MISIDPKEAASALSDINEIAHRVRQSTIYNFASLMLIMWGVLVLSGNIASYLWPREGGYIWMALNVVGLAGSFAIGIFESRRTSVHSFDLRMIAAFLVFFAFGILWSIGLGHFSPRQLGVFWPTYFMMVYTIVGLWVGAAFVAKRFTASTCSNPFCARFPCARTSASLPRDASATPRASLSCASKRSSAAFTSAGTCCCAVWHPAKESARIQADSATTVRSLRIFIIVIVSPRTRGWGMPM